MEGAVCCGEGMAQGETKREGGPAAAAEAEAQAQEGESRRGGAKNLWLKPKARRRQTTLQAGGKLAPEATVHGCGGGRG